MPPVLRGAIYTQTRAGFGTMTAVSVNVSGVTSATVAAQNNLVISLPCNCKLLAVACAATNANAAGTNSVIFNFSSGIGATPPTFGSGSITGLSGVPTGNGTLTLTITGPTPGTSQVVSIPYTTSSSQLGAALAQALNNTANPQASGAAVGGTLTLVQMTSPQVLAALGGGQTYMCTATAGTGVTPSPTTPTPFTPGTWQVAPPDNFNLASPSTPTSVFCGPGQFVFGTMRTVPTLGPNFQTASMMPVYAALLRTGLPVAGQSFAIPEYDIVFPPTRAIVPWLALEGTSTTTTVRFTLLLEPIILDPNQPYPAGELWTPRQQTIGAPSTA